MNDKQVLAHVYNQIQNRSGWTQGTLGGNGSMSHNCLVGAIAKHAVGFAGAVEDKQVKRILKTLGFDSTNNAFFFNDTHSHQQVVQYVRSKMEFDSVLRSRARKYPARNTVKKTTSPLYIPTEWEKEVETTDLTTV